MRFFGTSPPPSADATPNATPATAIIATTMATSLNTLGCCRLASTHEQWRVVFAGIDLLRTTGTYQSIVEEYRYLANGRFSRAREYQCH
jgi:hypothetical protein